jgi:DNA-binding NtrC family response regulator
MDKKLLIVEDEETLCESLKRVLSREGYVVATVNSAEEALKLQDRMYDLIITDIILPGINGIELIKSVKERNPDQIVVVMTAYASLETAVEALRAGAYDYIVKPVMHEEIKQIVKNAINQKALQKENLILKCQLEHLYDIETISLYKSRSMQKIINDLKTIADSSAGLVLAGEAGTEKELIAKIVHMSSRPKGPFVSVRCNTADINIFRKSLEDADGGIVFLDNVLHLNPEMKSALINASEERHLRTITAAEQDIESLVQAGKFSREIFQRISGVTLRIPPLRERKEDIEPLATYFVQKYSDEFCRGNKSLDSSALEVLNKYNWPGNVRELQCVIERAALICAGDNIKTEHLRLIL